MYNISFKWHNASSLLRHYGFEEVEVAFKNGDRLFALGKNALVRLKTNECIVFVDKGPDSKTEVFNDLDSLERHIEGLLVQSVVGS